MQDKNNKDSSRYSVNNLVKDFLEYFRIKKHEIVPSAPLLPTDPTLLFTAAGMVPFKAYYSDPKSAPYPRAASVQKCLRAGGKQSDLENVGRTLRHHTFFEMLGNFSFGDYFKKEAVAWGWELSVDVWGLDTEAIWISVFTDDDEAFKLWTHYIGFPQDRVVRLGKKDNFWGPVGDTGVCGPSSEMYMDTGEARGCGKSGCAPGCDCDRYIEYWNLVFPQFFYTDAGTYDPLPKPGIDTGLGLERLAFILQDAEDNFHTDEFLPIREAVLRAIPDEKARASAGLAGNVAADHVRALTFALAEGIMPTNEGRGYVLRRLLRRALTKMQPFGVDKPFLGEAVDVVIEKMEARYPDLKPRAGLVKEVITAEEERFLATLEQGMEKLNAVIDGATGKKQKTIAGKDMFLLYDTYGFPPELTEELALDKGLEVDRKGFEEAMARQKDRARKSSFHSAARTAKTGFVGTADAGATEFIGYDQLSCDANISAYRVLDAAGSGSAPEIDFVTDRTVFYAESGGQVGDTGTAVIGGKTLRVTGAFYDGKKIVHRAAWPAAKDSPELIKEFFEKHREAALAVDAESRLDTARNHTATHLLHEALRRVLGDHVAQAGSLVAPDRLRFDFHHHQAMRPEEVEEVENIVNRAVVANMSVTKRMIPYKEAVEGGAIALFGEKYGETVRVVSVDDFSMELCGGTHLDFTGEIGLMLIRNETAVGAGLRRIEAVTGRGAFGFVGALRRERESIAGVLRVAPEEVEKRVRTLLEENDGLQRRLKQDEGRRAKDEASDAVSQAEEVKGIKFVSSRVEAADVPALRKYGDELRNKLGLGLGLLCQAKSEKPIVLIVASDRLIKEKSITASDLAKRIAEALPFRGGGKPHMAQVGIPNDSDFNKIRDFVKAAVESLL